MEHWSQKEDRNLLKLIDLLLPRTLVRYGSLDLEGINIILKASARTRIHLWRMKNKNCFHVNILPGMIGVVFDEKVTSRD